MLYLFGLSLSVGLGILVVEILASKGAKVSFFLKLFLGAGLGLGLSAQIVFYSFLIFKQYSRPAILTGHLLAFAILIMLRLRHCKKASQPFINIPTTPLSDIVGFILILLLIVPLWFQGHLYPYGGWDAWSCWNLKGQFLFSGGENWRNMFDPLMWRSNTHYPFLLPLINVFGWSFYKDANNLIPLYNSITFPVITAGVLFFALKGLTRKFLAIIPVVALFTLPFFVKLAASQYTDIVLGYYLLAAVICLVLAKTSTSAYFSVLAGIMIGFLSFTKPEGTLAAGFLIVLSAPYLLSTLTTGVIARRGLYAEAISTIKEIASGKKRPRNDKIESNTKTIKIFLLACFVSLLPTVLFKLFLSPGNETFINGLTSIEKPSTFVRWQWIFAFLGIEFIHKKWLGLWIICSAGILLGLPKSFGKNLWIIPGFIGLYLLTAIVYYYVNTYFDLAWWLSVTLNRILFSILPLMVFWMWAGLGMEKNN